MDDFDLDAWLEEHDDRLVDDFHVVNGADRALDGKFAMLLERKFYADGRAEIPPTKQFELAAKIRSLTRQITSKGPFEALEALAELRLDHDRLELEIVAEARSHGWSWKDIARALGVSTATAHRRFAQYDVPFRRRRP